MSHALDRLFAKIEASRGGDPTTSYTAKLFQRGRPKIAQKLGEEAVEAVIELMRGDKPALIGESADLLYHLMVCWAEAGPMTAKASTTQYNSMPSMYCHSSTESPNEAPNDTATVPTITIAATRLRVMIIMINKIRLSEAIATISRS